MLELGILTNTYIHTYTVGTGIDISALWGCVVVHELFILSLLWAASLPLPPLTSFSAFLLALFPSHLKSVFSLSSPLSPRNPPPHFPFPNQSMPSAIFLGVEALLNQVM